MHTAATITLVSGKARAKKRPRSLPFFSQELQRALPILDNAVMSGKIVIERLEFRGTVGITVEERAKPQPLALDLEVTCDLSQAGFSDRLAQTVDYASVARRAVDAAIEKECNLLETMADRVFSVLFEEFPVSHATLWLRKLHPPINLLTSSVGIKLDRSRSEQVLRTALPRPASFLVQQLSRLPKGRALDIAAGRGRHTLFLASHGYHVEAIDRDAEALAHLAATARQAQLRSVTTKVLDLEQPAPFVPDFGKDVYDVIMVFFYLHRSLVPRVIEALKPGGMLIYETFTIDNYFHRRHPRRWEFCLTHNELLRLASPLQVLHYDEGLHEGDDGQGASYTARLLAVKPGRARV